MLDAILIDEGNDSVHALLFAAAAAAFLMFVFVAAIAKLAHWSASPFKFISCT